MKNEKSNFWQKINELNDAGYSQYVRSLISLIVDEESQQKCLEQIDSDPRWQRIFSDEIAKGTFDFKD